MYFYPRNFCVDEVRGGFESYRRIKEPADEIVYDLYGLTDEDIEIVEKEAVED
jgi:hypothetical protein